VVIRGKLDLAEEGAPKLLAESVLKLEQAVTKTAMVSIRNLLDFYIMPNRKSLRISLACC
jgi:hypothetical protein